MNRQHRRRMGQLSGKGAAPVVNRFFAEAISHHQAGRLDHARAAGLEALKIEANNGEILHFLGVVACQLGDLKNGIAYLAKAVEIKPTFVAAQCNYGQALLDAGWVQEALAAFDKALEARKDFGEVHDKRGIALQRLGRFEDALAAHSRACALIPGSATTWSNLAVASLKLGRLDEAEATCRRALALDPGLVIAQINLGLVLAGLGRIDEAEAVLRETASRNPSSDALYNLGCVLRDEGRLDDVVAVLKASIAARQGHAQSHNNLGITLRCLNRLKEAEDAFLEALSLEPEAAETRFNLALTLLVSGRLLPGWNEYEWRWKIKSALTVGLRRPGPQWLGQPLQGRTLLIQAEQGLGDAIQFVRYIPRLAPFGGRVVLEVQPELIPLLEGFPGIAKLIVRGEPCDYDLHCPLLSLPRVFATTLETIPAEIPYIHADQTRVEAWCTRLAPYPRPRIGLVWSGSPGNTNDRNRSLSVAALAPLLTRTDIAWFSLQKGDAAGQMMPGMIDLAPALVDFVETAAALAHLDMVITVDTSVAHLAGAMGKPTWVLLPFAPDWRWLLKRVDSPWYPTMRLFRQPTPGDWASVIQRIKAELCQISS